MPKSVDTVLVSVKLIDPRFYHPDTCLYP